VCPSLSSTIANIAASFPQVIWCCSGACCTHQLSDIADQAKEDQQNHTANLQLPPGTEAQKAHRKAAINKSGPKLNNSKKTYYNGFLRHFDNGCLERFADGLGKNQAMYQDLGEQRPDDVVPRFDLDLDLFPAPSHARLCSNGLKSNSSVMIIQKWYSPIGDLHASLHKLLLHVEPAPNFCRD